MIKKALLVILTGCLLLTMVFSALLTSGCRQKPAVESIIQGWVYTDGAISDANIAISNLKGKQIYKSSEPVTGEKGSFLIVVKNLPEDFRITASGGNIDGTASAAILSADYRSFDANTVIQINAVTTMASVYLDKNPSKTVDEAKTAIKDFLLIPDYVDIGSDLQHSSNYFNHNMFCREAEKQGGVTPYVNQLISEYSSNAAATHQFVNTGANMLSGIGGGGVTGYVVDKLAGGAISWAGGKFLGWSLDKIGIGFPDETADKLNEIQTEMKNISSKLDMLESQLNAVSDKLSSEIEQVGYDIRTGQMGTLISNIDSIRAQLNCFTSNPPADKVNLEKKRQSIINQIETHILGNENIIHNQLMGLNGQKSLLKVWVGIIASNHRFLSADDYPDIRAQFDYFDMMQQHQLELLVEYYHATSEDENYHPDCDRLIQDYATHLNLQKGILVQPVPDGVFVDTRNGMMWMRHTILTDQNGLSWAEYSYTPWDLPSNPYVVGYVYGSLDHFKKINPDAYINANKATNLGFSDWGLPSTEDLRNLMSGYSGVTATDWFKAEGAFPEDATFVELWGPPTAPTDGVVWTSDWYWEGSTSKEIVLVKSIGRNGAEAKVWLGRAYRADDKIGYAAIFPVRQLQASEYYYPKG